MTQNRLPYRDIAKALLRLNSEMMPAELHATLCGILCTGNSMESEDWLEQLFPSYDPNDLLHEEAMHVLLSLQTQCMQQLNDSNFGFQLLLPADEEPMEARLQALGDWCQGFMAGLAMGGLKSIDDLTDEAGEFARDTLEIARAGTSYDLDDEDEDENALTELIEYVRVGVLLVYEELQPVETSSIPRYPLH
jgi:yecA family protein